MSIFSYLSKRETGSKRLEARLLLRERLEKGEVVYKKDLVNHYGCVNAVEFSVDGDLLISGGDDRRVQFLGLS